MQQCQHWISPKRVQSKMTGKEIGKRGRLALVFNLRIIIVCRRLSTTYGKAAVKGNLALGLSGEVQGVIHIELILKDQRKRGNFIGQEERESTFPTKKPPCAQQESQCVRRLKERIVRNGELEEEALPKCNLTSCTQIESCRGNT